jgi:Glycosyltransferase
MRVLRIALVVPEKFFTMPELYGGGIVRAYKIYVKQLSKNPFIKLRFYHYNPTSKVLYLVSLIRNLMSIIREEVDVVASPCEVDLSMFFAMVLGIASRKPIVIVFNSVPLVGEVGYGLSSNEKEALKFMVNRCLRGKINFVCIIKSLLRYLFVRLIMFLARLLKKQVTAIAVTPHIGEELRKRGLKVANIYPGNGVEVVWHKVGLSDKLYDACYCASPVHVEKGLIDVLYIWYLVVRKIPNAKLVIAGRIRDDLSKNVIEELTHKLGLNKNVVIQVSYDGLPREKVIELLARCKVFIYPTRKDVWPLIVGEALSVETPVVVYALPNIEYAYSWHPAVKLIRLGDVVKFAEEVIKILQNVNSITTSINITKGEGFARKVLSWKRVTLLELKAIVEAIRAFRAS